MRHFKYASIPSQQIEDQSNTQHKPSNNTKNKNKLELPKKNNTYIVVQYTKGPSESVKDICNKHGPQVHFKGGRTIKNLLVTFKDRYTITQRSEVITDMGVPGLSVMKNISTRTFERGPKNIFMSPLLFMIIITSQVIPELLTASASGEEGQEPH